MQAAGLTRKDLDQKLGAGPGYVSQVLTGRMELKFRHILAILHALEVEPSVFFQTLYPENRPSTDAVVMEEFLRRFQRLGFGVQPAQPAPALAPQELEKLIQSAVRAALSEPPEPGDGGEAQSEEGTPGGKLRKSRGPRPRGAEKV